LRSLLNYSPYYIKNRLDGKEKKRRSRESPTFADITGEKPPGDRISGHCERAEYRRFLLAAGELDGFYA